MGVLNAVFLENGDCVVDVCWVIPVTLSELVTQ